MMKHRLFRILFCLLLTGVMLIPLSLGVSAKSAEDILYGPLRRDISKNYQYLDPKTGYRVSVIDEDDLIENTSLLAKVMEPITQYGDAIFWSCSVSEDEQVKQIDEWQDGEDKAKDSIVLVINLERGYLNLYSSGAIFRGVDEAKLKEISDEITSYASEGDFDSCARQGFLRVYSELSGEEATEPPAETKPSDSIEAVRYINPSTGYEVRIQDDDDLLSAVEESMLADAMKPITDYGHIMFWSTAEGAPDAEIQAREKRASYYGRDSAGILAINMKNRKVVFHADGAMYDAVNASDARSITDNVSEYASSKNYYTCAREAFDQVLMRLQGQTIAEPMKYTSYVVIGLMLAFVIVVGLAFGPLNPLSKKNKHPAKIFGAGRLLASEPMIRKTGSSTRTWVSILWIFLSSFSLGGGGSSGGGSSGGGGGSSGGGGGGSSSF